MLNSDVGAMLFCYDVSEIEMRRRQSYVDPPKLLHRIEGHDLLQQVIPIVTLIIISICDASSPRGLHLATWRFCEPQGPGVHERMLDIEVVFVMEHCDLLIVLVLASRGSTIQWRSSLDYLPVCR